MGILLRTFVFINFIFGSAFALEIQCETAWSDLTAVIKRSPQTSHTYLLFLNNTDVEKYWRLPDESIEVSNEFFRYQDLDTEVEIDLVSQIGLINSEGEIIRGSSSILLGQCIFY